MRYSLLSRFQGGLLGSQIGPSDTPLLWSQIGLATAESLVATQDLTFNWLHSEHPFFAARNTASSSEAALAIFPVSLFFHESPSLLKEKLQQAAAVWLRPSAALENVLAWGYALALVLREKILGLNLLSSTVPQLRNYVGATPLLEQLAASNGGLEPLRNRLGTNEGAAIAIALYCFCTTPEDFRLCVQRSTAPLQQDGAGLAMALTGALAGSYGGLGGIPIGWRRAGHDRVAPRLALARRLFAAWSGYAASDIAPAAAIASPRIIQKRAALKLLSQEE